MDENVHFYQHTAQLLSALVRHGKPYQLQVRIAQIIYWKLSYNLNFKFRSKVKEYHIFKFNL